MCGKMIKETELEEERETHKKKISELEQKLEEMRSSLTEAAEKSRQAKRSETKKLLSSITKLLLSTFPADKVFLCLFVDTNSSAGGDR